MTTERTYLTPSDGGMAGAGGQEFYPNSSRLLNMLYQQEPKPGDTAPAAADFMTDNTMNYRTNGTEMQFDEEQYYSGAGTNRPDPWTNDNGSGVSSGTPEMDTFEYLIQSLSSANNFISMLTHDQLTLLRAIRPSLIYEFLQEVLKARTTKRTRRPYYPNVRECAFCKNNGATKESYSSHALKDSRGRVLCPVLFSFRCQRCGATGDYAHTIKYCPEIADKDRNGVSYRRRGPPSSLNLQMGQTGVPASGPSPCPPTPAPPVPSPSESEAFLQASFMWNSFGLLTI